MGKIDLLQDWFTLSARDLCGSNLRHNCQRKKQNRANW